MEFAMSTSMITKNVRVTTAHVGTSLGGALVLALAVVLCVARVDAHQQLGAVHFPISCTPAAQA